MTSGTRPGLRRPRRPVESRVGASRRGGRGGLRAGFTLLEVILAIGLVLLVAGAAALSVGAWRGQADFEEGVDRFESALRLARAEAARLGVRVRLAFDDGGGTRVLYEPLPLESPGEFVEHSTCAWRDALEGGLFRVSRCELAGASAWQTVGRAGERGDKTETPMGPLTFYPDGTSDAAIVELRPAEESDARRALIELGASPGEVSTRMLGAEDLADAYEGVRRQQSPEASEGD
jgi:prepilin-type N-terminal cleavage/methylation domain-containing protein